MTKETIITQIAKHYTETLKTYGPSPRGVDWKDDTSHRIRHAQFLRLLHEDRDASVLDLGCGYGDFLRFLRSEGYSGHYVGYDVARCMIETARENHAQESAYDFNLGAEPLAACDYAIASGIFNVRRGADEKAWKNYVADTIDQLASSSWKGFGFNVLSTASDPEKRRDDLHYSDPVEMLKCCLEKFGRHVCLLQDYGLWEFTVLVRHSSQTARPNPVAP